MQFIINALGANVGGARRHLSGLLGGLAAADTDNQYRVLIAGQLEAESPAPNILVDRVSQKRGLAWRAWNEYREVYARIRREPIDAVVTLTNLGVVSRRTKNIVFQRNALYFADLNGCHVPLKMRPRILLQRKLALMAMKRADLVIVPSQSMKDLIRISEPRTENLNIAVMPHGFDADVPEKRATGSDVGTFPKNGTLTLLYPAGPAPHKDFETLIRAVKLLNGQGCPVQLKLTVELTEWPEVVTVYERLIKGLGLEESIRMVGRVSHEGMDELYKRADIVVFPSLCESFGYPLLEAMNWGVPIVASALPINQEMCGGGARYFKASDPESLADAIVALRDRSTREQLLSAQKLRLSSRDWSWAAYCKQFREILERTAREGCSTPRGIEMKHPMRYWTDEHDH